MPVPSYRTSHWECYKLMLRLEPRLSFLLLTFPQIQRQGLRSLFAFRHFIADGAKGLHSPAGVHVHMQKCRQILERVYESRRGEFEKAFEPALEQTILRFGIPWSCLTHALEGALAETGWETGKNQEEWLLHAYHRGGVWGALASYPLSQEKEFRELSILVGNALWLAARAPDVTEDKTKFDDIYANTTQAIREMSLNLRDKRTKNLILILLETHGVPLRPAQSGRKKTQEQTGFLGELRP